MGFRPILPEAKLFVIQILHALEPDARLSQLQEAGPRDCLLRLEIPGELGKTLQVGRRLVETAASNRWARQMLQRILRSELRILRSQRLASEARAALAGLRFDPPCPVCGARVPAEEPLFYRNGAIVHVRCLGRPLRP
jgi:hypothetical protein